jgi:hypothetical protein
VAVQEELPQRKRQGEQAAAASPRHAAVQRLRWLTLTWLEERQRFHGRQPDPPQPCEKRVLAIVTSSPEQ